MSKKLKIKNAETVIDYVKDLEATKQALLDIKELVNANRIEGALDVLSLIQAIKSILNQADEYSLADLYSLVIEDVDFEELEERADLSFDEWTTKEENQVKNDILRLTAELLEDERDNKIERIEYHVSQYVSDTDVFD